MSKDIQHFSNFISPETSGILWLTDEPLNYKSPGIYEFNYLLDGVVLQVLSEELKIHDSHFFLGKSFGKNFFLSHVQVKDKADLNKMYQHIETAIPVIEAKSKIHIYNKSKNTANINLLKELNKRYKENIFDNLNI